MPASESSSNLNKSLTSCSSADSIAAILKHNDSQSENEIGNEVAQLDIQKEKIEFLKIIDNKDFKTKSTAHFWKKNIDKFPQISRLAAILFNIPSSSAYIERFYSIAGNVCKQRCGNMSSETIIYRSVLKANIGNLDKLMK